MNVLPLLLAVLLYTSTSLLWGWSMMKRYSTVYGVPPQELADIASEHVPRPGQHAGELASKNFFFADIFNQHTYGCPTSRMNMLPLIPAVL